METVKVNRDSAVVKLIERYNIHDCVPAYNTCSFVFQFVVAMMLCGLFYCAIGVYVVGMIAWVLIVNSGVLFNETTLLIQGFIMFGLLATVILFIVVPPIIVASNTVFFRRRLQRPRRRVDSLIGNRMNGVSGTVKMVWDSIVNKICRPIEYVYCDSEHTKG